MPNNTKRPKYITDMINHANAYLRTMDKDGEKSSLFTWMCDYLRKHNYYQGFNLYKKCNLNGKETIILTDINDYEFIQLC